VCAKKRLTLLPRRAGSSIEDFLSELDDLDDQLEDGLPSWLARG